MISRESFKLESVIPSSEKDAKDSDDDLSIASNESEVPKESEDMGLSDEFQTDIESWVLFI